MNVFFDTDFTLVGSNAQLRPGVRECFQKLTEDGHKVYVWSGVRAPWEIANYFRLGEFISGIFLKPLSNHHDELIFLGIPVTPDFCVDDNTSIIDVFGGYQIPPYVFTEVPDDHMWRVYEAVKQFAVSLDGLQTQPVPQEDAPASPTAAEQPAP